VEGRDLPAPVLLGKHCLGACHEQAEWLVAPDGTGNVPSLDDYNSERRGGAILIAL
jgi:hypothetical protein